MTGQKERQKAKGDSSGMTFAKPKRDRAWDEKHNYQVASYRIDPEIKQAIKDIAGSLRVSTADIAGYFLTCAIEAYKRGDLKIELEPKDFQIKGE